MKLWVVFSNRGKQDKCWRHFGDSDKLTAQLSKEEMMEAIIPKQDRIGARVPHDVYETLCRAAELTGATVNQFLVQSALKEAQSVIEREEIIRLSPRDWNWMLELTENPSKPNAKLKAAMKRYQKVKRDDEDSSFSWKP
jgi:uncharacterized protein (DUF1778 family)